MKYFAIGDLHLDFYFYYAVGKTRAAPADPEESVVHETLDWLWKFKNFPETDGLILSGDYSNDYLTFKRMLPWLSKKYKQVYIVLGNHDLTVRGATPSKSNLQFTSSEQKIAQMKQDCEECGNIKLLDGEVVDGIGGTMGMCDFKCELPSWGLDPFTMWKRKWYDGKSWRYFQQVPNAIWFDQEKKMMDIAKQSPKVMVTHFVPYELGVPFDHRHNSWNYVFYFHAEPFFETFDNDVTWICGHSHSECREAYFMNSKEKKIHVICNTVGYPGDSRMFTSIDDYTGDKAKRTSKKTDLKDYILEV